tara:strand:- start:29 stop:358 length:330 start_codon:yes stop_codon:yes gene_type:complete
MTRKTNTMLIGLLGTILMGLATWTLVTLIELQTLMYMLQTELENVDKQFGRVYNFIDSVRGRIMIDKFFYNMFGKLDNAISFVETYAIKTTTWCWHSRVKLLKKKRSKK